MNTQLAIKSSITVDPAVDTPVTPPDNFDHVLIVNDGPDVLNVFMTPGSADVIRVDAGRERNVVTPRRTDGSGNYRFRRDQVAFYLRPVSGAGPVSLLWT